MTELFYKATRFIGLDKAILYQGSGIIIGSIGGIISLVLITLKFSPDEQGVYYTFTSIAALQVFFELGLTGIIVQYAAHEFAHLNITADTGKINGPERHRSRLSSLLHLFVKWYSITAFLLVILLLSVGFIFFNRYNKNPDIHWQIPWIILSIGTSAFFVLNMLLAFLDGCGHIKETSKIRTIAQAFGLGVSICCLYSGYGLYALGLNAVIRVILSVYLIHRKRFYPVFTEIWHQKITEKLFYWKEIFPYQWKIALSWLSGYFIFQLFNPVLFAYVGAKAAGQMGLTMAGMTLAMNFAMCWMNTKIPLFSMLVAKKDYVELDAKFKQTLKQVLGMVIPCMLFLILLIESFSYFHLTIHNIAFAEKFLPFRPLLLISVSALANIFIASFAIYLRCHKEEPYMWLSIITGFISIFSTFLLTKYFGLIGMTSGYCVITIITNIIGYSIYQQKKREWHHAA